MQQPLKRQWLKPHHFAIATAGATFLLLIIGGLVNPTGSSLACPDWPLCYGSLFPQMVNGVEYEHTHRVAATAVGVMTCFLAVLLWQKKAGRTVQRLGLVAVGAVVLQGVLGGITVLLRLPTAVSVAHLGLSMLFFALIIYLAFRTSPYWTEVQRDVQIRDGKNNDHPQRGWSVAIMVAVYVQLLLGALVRHTESGRVCGAEIPLCAGGQAWPNFAPMQLHMVHRYAALIVAAIVVVGCWKALGQAKRHQRYLSATFCRLLPWMVLLQIIIGLLTVVSQIGLWEVSMHLGMGALLWATAVALFIGLSPHYRPHHAQQMASIRLDQI